MDPRTALEELRSIDWRLLAAEGDLINLIDHGLERSSGGEDHDSCDEADGAEVVRHEIELAAVARELVAAAVRAGIDLPLLEDPTPMQDHAPTAYRSLVVHTAMLREQVRTAFNALTARHPELRDARSLDDGAPTEEDLAKFWRWDSNAKLDGAFSVLIVLLMALAVVLSE